jgi:hypothetical protein
MSAAVIRLPRPVAVMGRAEGAPLVIDQRGGFPARGACAARPAGDNLPEQRVEQG